MFVQLSDIMEIISLYWLFWRHLQPNKAGNKELWVFKGIYAYWYALLCDSTAVKGLQQCDTMKNVMAYVETPTGGNTQEQIRNIC